MAYGDFKDFDRRTVSDKIFHDKAFNIARNPKCNGYERGLASMVYKFLIKTLLVVLLKMKICDNKELAEELNKPITRKNKKAYSPFIDNIWGADLANMQLTSKFNKGIHFLLRY